jgi:hypothetical protein
LFDESNPARFELAAHSMRELIEKISLLTNGAGWAHGEGMKDQLVEVRRAYSALTQGQGFSERFSLDNSQDHVSTVLRELSRFFEWEAVNRPQLRERIAQTLSALSGPGQVLPLDVSENEVGRWVSAYKYFNMVAHNRHDTVDRDAFVNNMMFIEKVLLSRLQPPAIPELDALDALIKEGEDGH